MEVIVLYKYDVFNKNWISELNLLINVSYKIKTDPNIQCISSLLNINLANWIF